MRTKISRLLPPIAFALSLFTTLGAAQAAGDPTNGEQVFKRCASCHKIGEDAKNSVGPVLNLIIGRTAGTFPDFRYGGDMIAAGEAGLVWDEEKIAEYIADPRAYIRAFLDDPRARVKMSFKLRDENDRADVAAYLASLPHTPTE